MDGNAYCMFNAKFVFRTHGEITAVITKTRVAKRVKRRSDANYLCLAL